MGNRFLSVLVLTLLQIGPMRAEPLAGVQMPSAARVGLLGSKMSWQYYLNGGPYEALHTFIVNGFAVGLSAPVNPQFGILVSNDAITFDYSSDPFFGPGVYYFSVLSLPPTVHNGIAFDMLSGPRLTSVKINPATNMVGFDASRLSFTSNQIQVDWQGLWYDSLTIVRLDVEVEQPGLE